MILILVGCCIALACGVVAMRFRRTKAQRALERRIITPQDLHALMSQRIVLLFDVRQPLDLLGESEIIPGATWIAPEELVKNPALIPKDEDTVVYCTCPNDKTSLMVLRRAMALHFSRIQVLRGGLDAWKACGYQIAPYNDTIRLHTGE